MVEGVERFEAELRSHPVFEDPVLFDGGVPVLKAGSAQIAEVAGRSAELAVVGKFERAGVEPLVQGLVCGLHVARNIGPRIAAPGVIVVAEDADRDAFAESRDTGDLPAARDGISYA